MARVLLVGQSDVEEEGVEGGASLYGDATSGCQCCGREPLRETKESISPHGGQGQGRVAKQAGGGA